MHLRTSRDDILLGYQLASARASEEAVLPESGLPVLYIAAEAPWENGYAESFNSKVRDEWLNMEEFGSVWEAQVLAKE